jgi:transcriptional regulator with XRE-family HTH domain
MSYIRTGGTHTADPGDLPSGVFAMELKATRERKGWTQQQLASRLNTLDVPIDRSAVGKIEASKRGITLDELFFFAVALGVSPLSLIVPRSGSETTVPGDAMMQVAPNTPVRVWRALMWLRGQVPLPPPWTTSVVVDTDGEVEKVSEVTTTLTTDLTMAAQRFFYDSRPDIEAEAYRHWPAIGKAQADLADSVIPAALGRSGGAESVLRTLKAVRADLDAEIERTERFLADER